MPDDAFVVSAWMDDEVVAAALPGLLSSRKTLPPKLFYDDEGCRLFGEITGLPEYYLTRTELRLLETIAPAVAAVCPTGAALIEYGASDEAKAEFLLCQRDPLGRRVFSAYVPIDVAGTALLQVAGRLRVSHPDLRVHSLAADFLRPISLPENLAELPRLGFFPGSTIGNLEPAQARRFLEQVRATLGQRSLLLVGVDLRKDPAWLIPAYDDAAGVTAAFNRNILARLNREAGADFDLEAFSHQAVWNKAQSRIEMHLVSERAQTVQIAGRQIAFRAKETIHTENSYKWTVEDFTGLAKLAGWTSRKVWTDPEALFSIHLLEIGSSDP
jgi:L-histidine N-alpha-methyltransferase